MRRLINNQQNECIKNIPSRKGISGILLSWFFDEIILTVSLLNYLYSWCCSLRIFGSFIVFLGYFGNLYFETFLPLSNTIMFILTLRGLGGIFPYHWPTTPWYKFPFGINLGVVGWDTSLDVSPQISISPQKGILGITCWLPIYRYNLSVRM